MVQLVCRILIWLSWAGFAYVAWHTLLVLVAACRRRKQLISRQGELVRFVSQAENNEAVKQFNFRDATLRQLLPQMLLDLRSRNTDASKSRLDQLIRDSWFNADSMCIFGSLATRLGLFGTVVGIIAWFSGTTLHSPESVAAVGYALSTTAVGIVLASIIEISITRVFEPTYLEFCSAAEFQYGILEQRFGRLSRKSASRNPQHGAVESSERTVSPDKETAAQGYEQNGATQATISHDRIQEGEVHVSCKTQV